MIKGTTVTLYEKTMTGTDRLNAPIYAEVPVQITDVLVGEPAPAEAADTLNLYGKQLVYTLAIPKGDTHEWEDCKIEIFGKQFRAIGPVIQGIEDNIPLRWNKKIKVAYYE